MADPPLPVIIAGAGPCGLVAALTLQKSGVPFVLYERAAAAKLCSNAGSGIDMAPTAVNILEKELGLREGLDKAMRPYEYISMMDMAGRPVSTYRLKELGERGKITDSRSFGFANRADLQHALLEALGLKDEGGSIQAGGVLRCGVAVTGYRNCGGSGASADAFVEVRLSDGATARGSVLLACDGIHSAVRRHMCMLRDAEDPLRYCGQECWWGKTTVRPGSALDQELRRLAMERNIEDGGNVSLMAFGTPKRPRAFFSCEVAEGVHAWVYVLGNKTPPAANATDDLTRCGGTALTGEDRQREIDRLVSDRAPIIRFIMEHTPDEDITRAGLFDRANLNVPYVDGRVALLGDAAHPQSPMMGQGANMAIVDGYVAATRLASAMKSGGNNGSSAANIERALVAFDSKKRQKDNNAVIKKARKYGTWVASRSRFVCWALKASVKHLPASVMVNEIISGDKSNRQFVAAMNKDLGRDVIG